MPRTSSNKLSAGFGCSKVVRAALVNQNVIRNGTRTVVHGHLLKQHQCQKQTKTRIRTTNKAKLGSTAKVSKQLILVVLDTLAIDDESNQQQNEQKCNGTQ